MPATGPTLSAVRALRGPNRFAPFPVIQATLTMQASAADAALAFARRVAGLARALQAAAGLDAGYSQALPTRDPAGPLVLLGFGFAEEEPARAALAAALALARAGADDPAGLPSAAVAELRALAERERPSLSAAIVRAARERGIPALPLDDPGDQLQLGYGVYQRRPAAAAVERARAASPGDPGPALVGELFPPGAPARIPIAAVTGTNGKTTVTRLIAHLFGAGGARVGLTTTSGIYIGGELVESGDCAGPRSARTVLGDPSVEAAALEAARGGILRDGLGCDRCTVGVVTNISADHLGIDGVETLDDLAEVKRAVVLATDPAGAVVLNADDARVAAMAAAAPAEVIFFSARPSSPRLAAHLAAGGRAVLADGGALVLASGAARGPLVALADIPLTHGGAVAFEVANALAGAAAAWGAGLPPEQIARGLRGFGATPELVPGRFNVIEREGVQIVLDYGHNQAAMAALAQAVGALGPRRTIVAMCQPGDRRDDALAATIGATLSFGDHYVLYDLRGLRGRAPGEVPRIAGAALPAGKTFEVAADQEAAIERAWARAAPGERVVLLADESERALQSIAALPPLGAARRALPAAE